MELYLDTSDVVAVTALSRIFPLAVVTLTQALSQRVKNRWRLCFRNFTRRWAVRGVCLPR